MPKAVEPFYRSKEWRQLARVAKMQALYQCSKCGSGGRLIADHIHEIKDGGAKLDINNIQVLCIPCHNSKTAKAKAERTNGDE